MGHRHARYGEAHYEPPGPSTKELRREKDEQRAIVQLCRSLGCEVVVLSQPRPSHVTEGLPDLKVYCRRNGHTFWVEVKGPEGKQSPAQMEFQYMARACGEEYVLGGVEQVRAHLRTHGIAR